MLSIPHNSKIYALCHANSFYASCEQVFRPDLRGKTVVVLSNNDGCVIAQSKEAKELLELWMCRPWFEIEKQATALGAIHFSSNYELYACMSNRFSATLRQFTPGVEVYSIDESFLDLTGVRQDFNALGWKIKDTVQQWTGLGIGVGIGHTYSQAKLANHCAKRVEGFNGVCDLTSMPVAEQKRIFETMVISKVWGIGSRMEAKLNKLGVNDVWHLKNVSPKRARDEFGVLMERTIKELNGEPWIEFEEQLPEAKQVMSSRSFGQRIDNYQDMREAITFHATNAAQRMRKKGLFAGYMSIAIGIHDQVKFYHGSQYVSLPSPTSCSIQITQAALWLLDRVYKRGVYYMRASVMLDELVSEGGQQQELFGYSDQDSKAVKLMAAVDLINKKYQRGTIKLASEGIDHGWAMRRAFKSPNYTNDWNDVPQIR